MPTASDRLMGEGPKLIRETNQRVPFDSLLSQGLSTRPKLACASGLSQPTVIAVLSELVDARLVVPLGNDVRDAEGSAKFYQVSSAIASVITVDIGRVWVHVAVMDIAGDEPHRHDVRDAARSVTALMKLIFAEVSQARVKLLLDPRRTYAVVGSPGVFTPKRGAMDYADQLPGWYRPKLIDMLNDELGVQLQIENDVNLAVLAESIHGQVRRHESSAYFHIGTGIGLATILNGKLYHGFHGAVGEFVYLLTATGADGRARVLKDVVSTRVLTASARELGLVNPTPKAVLQLAATEDPTARRVMSRFVEGISATVTAINAVLDPECVVLGGGIGIHLQDHVAEISGTVIRRSPFHVDLEVATPRTDAMLCGAVDMGLETARNVMFRLGAPDDLGWQAPSIN